MTVDVASADICAPAHWHVPDRAGSYLGAVEGIAAKIGRTLDPTQRFTVDVLTSAKADGAPATLSAAMICPRQNLKTYILELITLTRLLRPGGDRLAVWSAHEVSTATETFRAFAELAEAEDARGRPLYPWFAERVKSISRATGRESITFQRRSPSGRRETCRLKFKARVKTGGRGLAGDLVILDEAFALEPAHMGSLLPILSTRAKGQIIYGSSAPLTTSLVLHDVIRRGRAGLMAYAEWRAPGSMKEPGCSGERCDHQPYTPGCVLDDLDLAVTCNPAAFHGRISREYLAAERIELRAMPAEYARERFGWGEDPEADKVVDLAAWAELADPDSRPRPWPVALAVDVAPGLTSAAVVAAGWREDGLAHVEVLAHRQGTAWLSAFLRERQRATGGQVRHVGGTAPVNAVAADWGALDVEPMTATEYAAGCGGIEAMVRDRRLRHLGDPILAGALGGAARKAVGDGGWVLQRSTSLVDICPAVAAIVALRALAGLPVLAEPMSAWR